jgi:hypothetical protein
MIDAMLKIKKKKWIPHACLLKYAYKPKGGIFPQMSYTEMNKRDSRRSLSTI